MKRTLSNNSLYRHYKGQLYYVIGAGKHTEHGESLVAYHALYGDNDLHFRPYDMFLSEVDPEAKNPTGQKYRFMLVGKEVTL